MRQALRYLAVASLLALTGCPQPDPVGSLPPPSHGNQTTEVPPPPPPPVHGN